MCKNICIKTKKKLQSKKNMFRNDALLGWFLSFVMCVNNDNGKSRHGSA